MSTSEHQSAGSESVDVKGPPTPWQEMGYVAWFLSFLAAVSLGLGVMNLLPIPILDGGHLLYYLIELVKGSPVSERAQIAGQYVGLVLLVALMGLAFYNDILRIAS